MAFRQTGLAIVRERYEDFGPTLAAGKLAEVHGLPIGVETPRQWVIDDGLWVRRRDRIKRVHQPRHRRDCLGELVQVDGCEHWWFEDRGPQCTLLVFVDDATSRLMHLSFVVSESAFAYFQILCANAPQGQGPDPAQTGDVPAADVRKVRLRRTHPLHVARPRTKH